ncbi:MAG: STAS domain-containing protein [Bacteroidota bacterium]
MVDVKRIQENEFDILMVVGEVDASSSIQLDNAIKEAVESGGKKFLIDCTHLEYISSAGLGVFMSYIEEIKKHDIKMVIYGLNEKVENVFQILGLDQLLPITENKEKAKTLVNEL